MYPIVTLFTYIYIYIYIYVYIVIYMQTVSLYRLSSLWAKHARCFKVRSKQSWFYVSRISYPRDNVIFSVREGTFLRISFYIHVIGYQECLIHEKSYCISAYVVSQIYIYIYIWLYIYIYIYIYNLALVPGVDGYSRWWYWCFYFGRSYRF